MFVDGGHSFELFKARDSMYASRTDVFHGTSFAMHLIAPLLVEKTQARA